MELDTEQLSDYTNEQLNIVAAEIAAELSRKKENIPERVISIPFKNYRSDKWGNPWAAQVLLVSTEKTYRLHYDFIAGAYSSTSPGEGGDLILTLRPFGCYIYGQKHLQRGFSRNTYIGVTENLEIKHLMGPNDARKFLLEKNQINTTKIENITR